jgi:Asp-tRNA(Asn)/Glu-tRNA(Gln) amidotransferase B subunit
MCVFNKIKNGLDYFYYRIFEFDRLKNLIQFGIDYSNNNSPVTADYYNGSDNDLENIFLELLHLSEKPINVFNRIEYSERIKFLADEGLNILSFNDIKPKAFKFTKNEIDQIITKKPEKKISKRQIKKNIKEAVEDYKKTVKSSVNLKPLKTKKNK